MTLALHSGTAERIDAALASKPDGVLESVAASCGVSLLDVFHRLPRSEVCFLPGSAFERLWEELSSWGDVLFIVHTPDIVLECTGALPPGTTGHGYFNIHGDSPIGGHIKASNCATIVLVDRLFHGRRSCSFQFLNGEGNAMFKVFVRRGKAHELDPLQLGKFDAVFSSRTQLSQSI